MIFKLRFNRYFFTLFCLIVFCFLLNQKVFAQCNPGDCYSGNQETVCCTNPAGCPGCPFDCCPCNLGAGECAQCCTQYCCDSSGNWEIGCCGGGCFTGETEINTENSKTPKLQIKDLEEGDLVSSFNPETGEIKENTVSGILKFTREGYYELETESGNKVKVTGEHPFLAIKGENNQAPSTEFQTTLDKVKAILSKTLIYKVISDLQAKVSEILR
jgi:hypothetical protein